MRKFVLLFLAIVAIGGIIAWRSVGSSPSLVIDEDLANQAIADGSAKGEVKIEEEVDFGPVTLSQVRALLGEKALQGAQKALQGHLETHPTSGAAHVLLAEVLRRQGRFELALEHAEAGLEALPTLGRVHWVHSMVLRGQLEKLGSSGTMGRLKAIKQIGPYRDALRTAIQLDPDNIDARKEEVLFYLYTPGIGDVAKGLELAKEIIAVDPMQGELTLARAQYKNGEAETAFETARKAITTYPDSPEPAWILGSLLYEDKQFEKAEVVLAQATEMGIRNETYYQVLYRRMRIRTTAKNRADETLAFANEYIQANPLWEWAPPMHRVLCEKGRALRDLGRIEEAKACLHESLALDPTFTRAQKTLDGLPD